MKKYIIFFFLFLTVSVFSQTPIVMSAAINNQTISTCNGFIIDSGGQGGSGYSNGENVTVTICPDTPGEIVSIVFNFFALSTTDDNPAPSITNVDYMDVYDGPSTASPTLGTYTGNQLQGVVINATALNTSGCITLRFRSNSTGTGQFTASATCETPCATPFAGGIIAGGITSDSTVTCVGTPINFTNFGSSAQMGFNIVEYKWDFMDGSQAFGQNVTHTFDTPGQYLVQLFVTDDNGCGNTNLIDLQVLVATIPTFIGFPGDTTLCLGESASYSIDPNTYEVLWDGFPGSATIDDGCLPDTLLGVSQDVEIMQTGFTPGTTLQNVSDVESFCIDLEHSFMGDLVIIVQCPNGQTQIMHQQGGGGTQIGVPVQSDDVDCSDPTTQGTPFTYCFTPMATETWVDWVNNSGGFGLTLPAGDYAPVEPFTNLLGCPLNGIWTLTVIDNWAADDGTLFAFDINLNPALYPPVTTFQPQIGLGSDSSYWNLPAPFGTISNNNDDLLDVPTAAGSYTYTYTVVDNFGCVNDSSMTITVNDNVQADAGPDVTVCDGSPVQFDGSVGGGSPSCDYTLNLEDLFGDGWNGDVLNVTINGVTTPYTIAGFGSNATFTFSITHGTPFTVQFPGIGTFNSECYYQILDGSGNLLFEDGGGFVAPSTVMHNFVADCYGGLQFAWTPSANLNNAAILDPIGTFSAPTTLTLTVFPAGHPLCATTDQVNVTLSASANPGNDGFAQVCAQGAPIDLFPILGAGASPNGTWTNPAGATIVMPYNPVTMNPGMYTYTVDSNGCVSSAIITVSEINTTVITTPTNVSCNSANNGSVSVTYTNGTNYILNGGASTPAPASPFVLNNLAPGNYTLEIIGASGCSAISNFVITEPNPLAITSTSPPVTICPGATTNLSAVGSGGSSAYTFTWIGSDGSVTIGNPAAVTPMSTTTYLLILTEACGSPADSASVIITTPPAIALNLQPDDANGCVPHAVNFTNTSANGTVISSVINFGDGTTANTLGLAPISHVYTTPGVYTVTITSTSDIGCVYTKTYTDTIEVYSIPNAAFTMNPNPASMFNPEVNLINNSSSDVDIYNWIITGGTPASSTLENLRVRFPDGIVANYPVTLVVTSENGCVDTMTQIVQIISEVILYAPNTFTPDGDEFNQDWRVYIDGIDQFDFELLVYNRWGEVVWESRDSKVAWDGTYKGKYVQQGTYTWTIRCKDATNDRKYTFEGHMTIIR
jgi:gliding motility-associated-like protein